MNKVWFVLKLGYARLTKQALSTKVRNSITMMTGNAAFVNPVPTLAELLATVDKLDAYIQTYEFTHSRVDKEARDNTFALLKLQYKELGSWVQTESRGEQELITSAGFETEKVATPVGLLPAPARLEARSTAFSDRVEVKWGGVRGRNMYFLYICAGDPNVEEDWKLQMSTTKSRVFVSDLKPFQTYYFRVAAQGAAGMGPLSDVAKAVAA